MLLLLQQLGLLGLGGASFPRARTRAIDPSRMDRFVRLERAARAQDAYGAEIITWELVAEVWAEFAETRGGERFADRRIEPHTAPVMRIRYRDDIDERMRIVDAGTAYDIDHIAEIGRRAGLEITLRGPE